MFTCVLSVISFHVWMRRPETSFPIHRLPLFSPHEMVHSCGFDKLRPRDTWTGRHNSKYCKSDSSVSLFSYCRIWSVCWCCPSAKSIVSKAKKKKRKKESTLLFLYYFITWSIRAQALSVFHFIWYVFTYFYWVWKCVAWAQGTTITYS